MIGTEEGLRFEDSEQQALLRSTARAFLAANYPWTRLFELEAGKTRIAAAEVDEIARLGWLALTVPEAAGGAGLTLLEAAVIIEEVGYSGAPLPVVPANVAADLLGTPAPFRSVGEEVRGSRTELAAAGGMLAGTIGLVAAADISEGILTTVDAGGELVFGVFETSRARLRHAPTLDLAGSFDVMVQDVPDGALEIVATGAAAAGLAARRDLLIGAFRLLEAVGMMRRVVELTSRFITDRIVFGQPVAKFQAARHRAANLFMDAEVSRWATYHALGRLQADAGDEGGVWLARHWATRATERIVVHTHMLHGGMGVTMEYPLHLFTQGLMARAVRGGTLDEMTDRATAWLDGDGIEPVRPRSHPQGG